MRMERLSEFWRLMRFSLVGACATVVYVASALIATELVGIHPVVGAVIGYCMSFAFSYFGHFHFTFAAAGRYRDYLLKSIVTSGASFVVSTTIMWFGTAVLNINYKMMLVLVAVTIPICSYLVNRFWVFLHPGEVGSSDRPIETV